MTRLSRLLLLAALAGCAPATPPRAPEPVRVPSSPYYPLKVGTRWLYQSADHQLLVRVVRHEKVGKTACALLESFRDGTRVAREHVFAREDGVFRLSADGKLMDPPLPLLKMPPKRNQRWTVTFEQRQPLLRGTFLTDAEEIDVAVGSFTDAAVDRRRRLAVTLQGEITEDDVTKVGFRYWFVWDVGIVKQVLLLKGRTIEYELIKFSGPG